MARPKIPTINWRSELAQLDKFLSKQGGVVHIRTTSESPSSAFAKALRSRMEYGAWGRQWLTVQIDGNNAATRYLIDMIHQFERTLEIDSSPTTNTNVAVEIGCDIVAGGNIDISDVHVHIPRNGAQLHDRAERINSSVLGSSTDQRLGIIVFDSDKADPKELSAFRAVLWDNGFERIVSNGLLLIVFIDNESGMPHWLPEADLVIDLPTSYSDESALHAIEDMKNYFISQQLASTENEAHALAVGMLSSQPKPKVLHANFAATLSNMEKWR
jgi:hypothetical protein